MKNPLNKRILRELIGDLGKYLVIFLFMIILTSALSGYLVADDSMVASYEDSFDKYNIEDGHLSFDQEPDEELIDKIEDKSDVTLYDLSYFEETIEETKKKVRVYKDRTEVDKVCLMSGDMPEADDEIALDRMFAENNDYEVGDSITLNGKKLTISGLVALSDYTALYENNSDMMFDAINFSVAIVTEDGFDNIGSSHITYNYAWKYDEYVAHDDDKKSSEMSDDFLDNLKDVVKDYDEDIAENLTEKMMSGEMEVTDDIDEYIFEINDYLPLYLNQAVNFAGDDMGQDKSMMLMFGYILIVILAFVFAVTTSNTIAKESGVIGTLRASGYTRGELIRHYMVIPMATIIIAAIIGNIIGYTYMKDYMSDMYYGSYSLPTYVTLWNSQAFIETTLVPVILMFFINLFMLWSKLKLSPLRFLRHDISKRGKKKAFRLSTKLPIMHRFRLRIIFQNIPGYLVLFFGIILGGAIIIFGNMFGPMLDNYADTCLDSRICDYQYVLANEEARTDNEDAEAFCMRSFDIQMEGYVADEVSTYGIVDDSEFVTVDIPEGQIIASSALAEKYGLKKGDEVTLKDTYTDDEYTFKIGGTYKYDASIAMFMDIDYYRDTFDKGSNYITGYFSNEKLTDLKEDDIATTITADDLTKVSDQLNHSMSGFMDLLNYFGIIVFLLLMYVLSKQIIEKNAQSISMTKILGYTGGEIAGLYIIATSIVVIISLGLCIPIVDVLLRLCFKYYIYTMMPGYFPYNIGTSCYIIMLVSGILSYLVVAVIQMIKINKIPKTDALKNVE